MRLLLGAKSAPFGCMYAETVGCKVCAFWVHVYGSVGCMCEVVGCKVCGEVWVQSLCLLGACPWLGWVHVCGCWVQSIWRRLGAKYAATFGCMPDSR